MENLQKMFDRMHDDQRVAIKAKLENDFNELIEEATETLENWNTFPLPGALTTNIRFNINENMMSVRTFVGDTQIYLSIIEVPYYFKDEIICYPKGYKDDGLEYQPSPLYSGWEKAGFYLDSVNEDTEDAYESIWALVPTNGFELYS